MRLVIIYEITYDCKDKLETTVKDKRKTFT